MRVRIIYGDGRKLPKCGNYKVNVTVFAILMPDKSIHNLDNPEIKPTEKEISESGGDLMILKKNPKIVLDGGKIVYGCQVTWRKI